MSTSTSTGDITTLSDDMLRFLHASCADAVNGINRAIGELSSVRNRESTLGRLAWDELERRKIPQKRDGDNG